MKLYVWNCEVHTDGQVLGHIVVSADNVTEARKKAKLSLENGTSGFKKVVASVLKLKPDVYRSGVFVG